MGAVGPKTNKPTVITVLFRRGIHCARNNLCTPSSIVAVIHFCRHQTPHKPVFQVHWSGDTDVYACYLSFSLRLYQ